VPRLWETDFVRCSFLSGLRTPYQASGGSITTSGGPLMPVLWFASREQSSRASRVREVINGILLLLLFVIPGLVYYIYMESVPYCSGCGRRVSKQL
jgi:hypothetical protein